MDTVQPTPLGKYSAEDWDDVFTQNSDSKYLNEYHVPDWVMASAMQYHYTRPDHNSRTWLRYSKPLKDR